jgi:uncharacterized protein YjiK
LGPVLTRGQAQQFPEGILFLAEDFIFNYELSVPDKKTKLPSELREISGIQLLDDGRIAAIEDEHGKVYIIEFSSGEIKEKIRFGDNGDYEGIAIVDNNAWILKSNGNLYRVKDFQKGEEKLKTKKYETGLSKKNDTEGLAYDRGNHQLLIACKGHPHINEKDGTHQKAIYSFDIENKILNPDPILIIELDTLKDLKDYNLFSSLGIRIMSYFDENKGDVTFQPSDIAVHPISGNYYIISAVGDLLLVYSPGGKLLAVVTLADSIFKQAEGICFDTDGDLYISNEGGEGKANILKFNPKD